MQDRHISVIHPVRGPLRIAGELSDAEPRMDFFVQHFELDKIVEQVWRHVIAAEDCGWRARHLIMGADIYGPFMDHALREAMSFAMPAEFEAHLAGPGNPHLLFRGMNVHLIPWMHGCVALPELENMSQPGRHMGINPWAVATPLEEIVIPAEQVKLTSIPPEGRRVMEGLRAAMVRWLLRPANVLRVDVPGMKVVLG